VISSRTVPTEQYQPDPFVADVAAVVVGAVVGLVVGVFFAVLHVVFVAPADADFVGCEPRPVVRLLSNGRTA
jgi:hypothetical protein